jgi:anti-sigma factor RsiW
MKFHGQHSAQERFELLSAYVDNEVTRTEKSQVEQWLQDDPSYRHQYQQLLKVKRLLQNLPAPSSIKTEYLVDQVFTKIARRSQRKLALGAAIIALFVATFESLVSSNYRMRVADESVNKEEQLILAMEEPIIPMPQAVIKNP